MKRKIGTKNPKLARNLGSNLTLPYKPLKSYEGSKALLPQHIPKFSGGAFLFLLLERFVVRTLLNKYVDFQQ